MSGAYKGLSAETRFWMNVARRGEDECWLWLGPRTDRGYGRFRTVNTSTVRKRVFAHRFSYELASGQPIPAGLFVCHSCDNPPCVNPNHLWVGTHADNVRDKVRKGRQAHVWSGVYGNRHGRAKLNEDAVRDIRRRREGGESVAALASEFGVSSATLSHAATRRTWRHV